jgi:hypothetical protein
MAVGSSSSGYYTTMITANFTLVEAIEKICFGELAPMDVYAQLPAQVRNFIDMLADEMSPEFGDAGVHYRRPKDFALLGSDQQLSVFRELRSLIKDEETKAAADLHAQESRSGSSRAVLACVLLVTAVPSYMMFAAGGAEDHASVAQTPPPAVEREASALTPSDSDPTPMTESKPPELVAPVATATPVPDVGAYAAAAGPAPGPFPGRATQDEKETVATIEAPPTVRPTARWVAGEVSADPPTAVMEEPPLGMAPPARPTQGEAMQVDGNQADANQSDANRAAPDAEAGKVAVAPIDTPAAPPPMTMTTAPPMTTAPAMTTAPPITTAPPMTTATTMAPPLIKRPAAATSTEARLSVSPIAGPIPLPRQRPHIVSRVADETRPQGLDFFLPPALRDIFR